MVGSCKGTPHPHDLLQLLYYLRLKNFSSIANNDIQDQLSKFWELQNVSPNKLMSVEEQACEKYFNETTTRDDCGRFVVSLPFKDTSELLGDSLTMAKNRFLSLERYYIDISIL